MGIFSKWHDPEHDDDTVSSDMEKLHDTVLRANMPPRIEKAALREIEKLVKTNTSATEYTIGSNYIEYLASLPWNTFTEDNLDIDRAQKILDEDHYGLHDIKERILEYLAVRILKLSCRHNVLLADDDETARSNLEHVLSREGYIVSCAAGGDEAISLLEKKRFDLVVTDLKMKGADGLEVLEKAKAMDPSTEVIIVTGYATTPTAVEAMQKGSFHFLAKPLQLDELRETSKKALAKKKTELSAKGPILCFVGPPGTGKTSLQRSIARCLGRKFIRISLAGMKDEAEIRGHRRSYVGALPGRIIQEIRRAGSRNPLVMLDEIDKIGQDFKGDPASALLEVLDHTQNSHFIDNYLDLPFDLSRVMFIATANTIDPIPPALLDRLELLHLSGYTEEEKEKIAFDYLIPRQIEEAGLSGHSLTFTPEAVRKIVREYTREAGLRNIQRQLAAVCRKLAREIVLHDQEIKKIEITGELVEKYLGPRRYFFELADDTERIGVATGLALTEAGGQILFIEATIMKGKETLILTGSLGEVMKESAQAALSYIRSNAALFHINDDFFDGHDIHIHIPAGAVPKDGPSAGLTIAIALLSLLTRRPVRRDVALTGELTLSGRVLPVSGIRDKILAARRAGVKTVILPLLNTADLKEIPEEILQDMKVVTTNNISKVIDLALR
ncbi:MAG: endopeptidase La [Proteobacteria bacterium]|nr:endopeptidase La [Pseudomonadota bacterium]MBU1649254.1 endopeptidase La [Pseudomonadota bacterium]